MVLLSVSPPRPDSMLVSSLQVCFAFFLDELPDTDVQLTAQEIAQVRGEGRA